MTPTHFLKSTEYMNASESAKIEYHTRLGILLADKPATQSAHELAYQDFKRAVHQEEILKGIEESL